MAEIRLESNVRNEIDTFATKSGLCVFSSNSSLLSALICATSEGTMARASRHLLNLSVHAT